MTDDLTQSPRALNDALDQALDIADRRLRELNALMKGARAVLARNGFTESARAIFDHCCRVTGATSGYVALLSDDGMENEVLFLEAGNLPCTVDPELPMPIRGLRAKAYRSNRAVFDNDFMNSKWVSFMPKGHVAMRNVMFAPLVLDNKTVGIMGLANKPGDFDEHDAKMAAGFGELAAIALEHSRNRDRRKKAEDEREQLIRDLKGALAQVKQLSGLLPVCSICKKIRDDKGLWQRMEAYVEAHSEAQFSHGICRECADKHYPEMKLYEE